MKLKDLEKTIDLLQHAREAMIYVEHAGGTNVNCELDESGDGNQFVDIWDVTFNGGRTIASFNIRDGNIILTNELNGKVSTLPEFKQYLSNGLAL